MRAPARQRRFPTFMVLGVPNGGSDRLVDLLNGLRDVTVSALTPGFFSHEFPRGLRWYRDQLDAGATDRYLGDHSVDYLRPGVDRSSVAARMDGALPGLRLVAVLREPIERAYADLLSRISRGAVDPDVGLLEYIDRVDVGTSEPDLVAEGLYAHNLLPYIDRYGERLMLVDHRRVVDSPVETVTQVANHIGVPVTSDPVDALTTTQANGTHQLVVPPEVREGAVEWFEEDLRLLGDLTGFGFS